MNKPETDTKDCCVSRTMTARPTAPYPQSDMPGQVWIIIERARAALAAYEGQHCRMREALTAVTKSEHAWHSLKDDTLELVHAALAATVPCSHTERESGEGWAAIEDGTLAELKERLRQAEAALQVCLQAEAERDDANSRARAASEVAGNLVDIANAERDEAERQLIWQWETHHSCPCGARPESPSTHPHSTGCPTGRAIQRANEPLS